MGTSSVHGGFDTHSLPPRPEVNQELTNLFLESRRDSLLSETLKFYEGYLRRSMSVVGQAVTGQKIKRFLDSQQCNMPLQSVVLH
jgi:hypothetical protein